jgi:FAD/FMN-containing dehydrogenase
MHVSEEDDFVASAAVYPSTTEEVQAIVRWANKHRIPISPISIGRNCKITTVSEFQNAELTSK